MDPGSGITPRDLEFILCDEMAEPKALPLSLLEEITDGFSDEHRIGTGGFAVVFKGMLENRTVAVKRMSNAYMHEKEFQREVECLMMVKHKKIVRFLGYCADTQGTMARHEGKFIMADVQQRLLCFEYLPKGSLQEYITDTTTGLQWRDRYHIIKGICQGLHYLHQKNIVHLDLKPGNILLDRNFVAKIADFGLSRCFGEMQSRVITVNIGGTLGYLAPEFGNGEITYRFDIYSLGVIITEILTGKKGYHSIDMVVESWSRMLEKSQSGVQLEQVRVCAEIGMQCSDFNPANRPDTQYIIDRLDETESMDEYIGTSMITSQQEIARTASKHKVFGREVLRDYIMMKLSEKPHGDALSSSTSRCYSVIGIYGVAGPGRNTFAQYIRDYIKEECKEEKLFDTFMYIHLSETFSVDDVFREMLFEITRDRYTQIPYREELEVKLKESLCGKRFFLILDDLWVKNKDDSQLKELMSPLNVGMRGSKVLVMARTQTSARILCECDDEPIEMPDLDEDRYFSVFMLYTFGSISVPHEEFIRVGRKIAKKLHRLPIAAATVVAGQLGTNKDINFWKTTAELDMLNDTMDALWWSYQQLNLDNRRCLEYCNIFPRGFKLRRDELVHLWIAQGFVKTSFVTEEMEDVAEGYIQELLSCSFLQPEGTSPDTDCFTIHNVLHDVLDKVARNCFRIENGRSQSGKGWEGYVPRDVQHLFVQKYDAELIAAKILGLENLRSLIVYVVEEDTPVEEDVIDSICKRLPKLRVLAVAFSREHDSIKEPITFWVPKSINQLKHIRYLCFRTEWSSMVILPSTLNKLEHIQLLDFGHGHISEFTFAELTTLRHILFLCTKFPNIGRLVSLQTMTHFTVSNEQGYEIKQLRNLNRLRGSLTIRGLENVKSKEEAVEASLAAKERLSELILEWDDDGDTRCSPEVEAEVLEGLCPPAGLEKLQIGGYQGLRYPDWMVGKQNGGPKDLQVLQFLHCNQWACAPQLEAFPHLRVLDLYGCRWNALPGNMEHLTSLNKLQIHNCFNIRLLPTLPQSLEKFIICGCNNEFVKSCRTVGHPNWQKIEHIPEKYVYGPASIT